MTELAKQLAGLSRPQPALPPGTRASLLFDVKDAAKIDKDVIFSIGANGLEELRQVDERFLLFYSDLFNEGYADAHYVRDVLNQAQVKELDGKVNEVVSVLAPHFLNRACHKVLEFLIRYYNIHIYARDHLILMLLPYHDTKLFVRLLQLVQLTNSKWEFLRNHQKAGAVLLRSDLVTVCCKDGKLLPRVLETAGISVIHMRFAAVLAIQTIAAIPNLSDTLLHVVLPRISVWLQSGREPKAGAYLMLIQIASRHPFAPEYLNAIIMEVLASANAELGPALKLVLSLLKTHSHVTLSNQVLDALSTPECVETTAALSINCDTRLLTSLMGKRVVGQISTKGEEAGTLASVLISAEKIAPETIEVILGATLTQYITQKKSKGERDFPLYASLLGLIGDRHPGLLASMLPKVLGAIRTSHQGEKTKTRLYSLVSRALSGLPLDETSDLPLFLALNSPLPEVRLAAASQLQKCVDHMRAPILEAVRQESNYDVLLAILNVSGLESANTDQQLFEALKTRLFQDIEKKCERLDVLKRIFELLIGPLWSAEIELLQLLKILIVAHEHPALTTLAYEKVNALARVRSIFPVSSAEQTLETHLKNYATEQWLEAYPVLAQLVSYKTVSEVLRAVFDTLKTNQEFMSKEIIESVSTIVGALHAVNIKLSDHLNLSTAIITACPVAIKVQSESLKQVACSAMKRLLGLLLPVDSAICLTLVKKHFREQAMDSVSELACESMKGLEMLVLLATLSGSPNVMMQTIPYLFLGMSGEKPMRNQALTSVIALLKGKTASGEELKIKESDSFTDLEGNFSAVTSLLHRVMKHKTGILNDGSYFSVVLSKVTSDPDWQFLVACVKALADHRIPLLTSYQLIVSDSLTDLLIPICSESKESRVVIARLKSYKNWSNFQHMSWVCKSLQALPTAALLLQTLTSEVFSLLSPDNQTELFHGFLSFLCDLRCGELSADAHLRLSEYSLSIDLLHGALQGKLLPLRLEKLLEICQYAFKEPSAILLSDLFTVLQSLSSAECASGTEFLKQLVLSCIRLHYPAIMQLPSLQSVHIQILASCVIEGDSSCLQTKAQMYSTLASCCHMFPTAVATQLKESFRTCTMKHGKLELIIMKHAMEQVAIALLAHRVSLTGILLAVIEGAGAVTFENGSDLQNLMVEIAKKAGAQYISNILLHLLTTGQGSDTVLSVMQKLPVLDVLEALQKLTQLLPLLLQHPKTKLEKKAVEDGLSKLESSHLQDPDEVTLMTIDKLLELHMRHLALPGVVADLAHVLNNDSVPEHFARVLLNTFTTNGILLVRLAGKKKDLKPIYKRVNKTVKLLVESICDLLDSKTFTKVQCVALETSDKETKPEVKQAMLDLLLTKAQTTESKKYVGILPALFLALHQYQPSIKSLGKTANQSKAALIDTFLITIKTIVTEKFETAENVEVLLPYAASSVHQIRSNSLLCLAHFFRTPRPDLLPHLATVVTHLFSHFQNTVELESIQIAVEAAYLIVQGMHEFITPHIEKLVFFACESVVDPDKLLKSIGTWCPIRVMFTPISAVIEVLSTKSGPETLRLMTLIQYLIQKLTPDLALTYAVPIGNLFETAFNMHLKYVLEHTEAHPQLSEEVQVMVDALTRFSLNLTNAQFKPMFLHFCEWVGIKEDERIYRTFIFFSAVKALVRGLKSHFGPYFPYFIEEIVEFLKEFSQVADEKTKKRKRGLTSWTISVNNLILQCVSNFLIFDKGANMTEATYDQLSSALISEIALIGIPEYDQFVSEQLSPCLVELFASSRDETVWKGMNYKLLLQTRNKHADVRRQSLNVLVEVGNKLGEPFASLVSDVMPFVTEGLEDEQDEVTAAAKTALRLMERLCGEDIQEYLK